MLSRSQTMAFYLVILVTLLLFLALFDRQVILVLTRG